MVNWKRASLVRGLPVPLPDRSRVYRVSRRSHHSEIQGFRLVPTQIKILSLSESRYSFNSSEFGRKIPCSATVSFRKHSSGSTTNQETRITMRTLTTICFILLFAAFSFGQSNAASGELRGIATDQSGAVMTGVRVTVTNDLTSEARTVTSDELGEYRFLQLPPGDYSVQFERDGFKR